jgi:hypothetical protein
MAEMAEEYRRLNSQIARMTPDDILKALETENVHLKRIRKACPWIGYSHIRQSPNSPILSMALVLKLWHGSAAETPVPYISAIEGKAGRPSVADAADALTETDADLLIEFLSVCYSAWGKDKEHMRLYGSLNLGLCMWLYRRTVISPMGGRVVRLDSDIFKKCAMSVAASGDYIDFLLGRQLRDRDRSPGYGHLRRIFVSRLEIETGKRAMFPKPVWATS